VGGIAPGWPLNEGLRRLRHSTGLKQAEVADRLRDMVDAHRLPGPDALSQPTISELERGTQRIPLSWLAYIDREVFEHPKGTLLRLADLIDPMVDLDPLLAADPILDDGQRDSLRGFYRHLRTEAAVADR
jgi:transcriptional regulator with XRE-family HTH domain